MPLGTTERTSGFWKVFGDNLDVNLSLGKAGNVHLGNADSGVVTKTETSAPDSSTQIQKFGGFAIVAVLVLLLAIVGLKHAHS